jgi:putative alpha-1,2-mannosidase
MSSWWLFGALGMYPELPGADILVCGSPLFPKVVLHLPAGDVTIIGGGAGDDAPYVQALNLNGQPSNKPWFRYSDISHGGILVYTLGPAPDTSWGSNLADAPPSYQ